MPRWFHGAEQVPHLPALAAAVRDRRQLRLGYRRGDDGPETTRVVRPLGLVNKAGIWYLVAIRRLGVTATRRSSASGGLFRRACCPTCSPGRRLRPGGVLGGLVGLVPGEQAEGRGAAARVAWRRSPLSLRSSATSCGPPRGGGAGAAGFREVTLTFEHEIAAATRLAGFGGQVEVLSPASVRTRLIATARELLDRYPRGR